LPRKLHTDNKKRVYTRFFALSYTDANIIKAITTRPHIITASRSLITDGEKNIKLTNALRYIGANYSADIRISDLAATEHLSVSRFNYLFKEQMGMPPTKFILRLRMSCAKELLISTDLPVKQIGIMCGYTDPHFFSKVFKDFCGTSPAEYRKGFGA
jgi:transcriptional regulator GlxA family with amidase domain